MNDLDTDSMIQKALNSESSEVFKYQWSHVEGDKKGELKFFFLKITNKN
jgi:hypothetical protein